jgi:hypothetical protein
VAATNDTLAKALRDKLTYHREHAPIYRLRQPSVAELVERARVLGGRFLDARGDADLPRTDLCHEKNHTVVRLPDGGHVKVYHASGALGVARQLEPFAHVIGPDLEADRLIAHAAAMIKRLDVPACRAADERIAFERLWKIKAQGMTRSGDMGAPVVCRVVAAFRRYVGDLPVWGRASIMVKLAGRDLVEAVGVDWRDRIEEPVDHAKIIDPDEAIHRVLAELAATTPGRQPKNADYEPVLFSAGYFSLPKRRAQGYLQPVYVAALRARGEMTMSRLVVVPGTSTPYESIGRIAVSPPIAVARRAASKE